MISSNRSIYIKYITISWLILMVIAGMQFMLVFGAFEIKFIVVPSVVGVIIGYFLASQKVLRREIEVKQKEFVAIVEMAEEVSYLKAPDGAYQFISTSVKELTGYDVETFYDFPNLFSDLVFEDDKPSWLVYERRILEGEEPEPIEIRLTTKNKGLVWIRHVSRPVYEEGELVALSSTNTDISDQVKQAEKMEDLASNDPLTGLPNRRRFNIEARKLLKVSIPFSLVMMDLDRFKTINDSLGHSIGDLVIQKVAERLQLVLPHQGVVARFGGDEFVFLLPGLVDESRVESLVLKTLESVEKPMTIEGFNLHISASFGWVHAPEDGQDVDTLIRLADAAMYMAKQKQGVSFLRYSGHVDGQHQRLLLIENRLREAVENNQVVPFYQPLVDSKTGVLVGVECLARWHDEELGWVAPNEFISLAETTNLIGKLGESILEQAIDTASRLHRACDAENAYFSVNASPYQLSEIGFVDKVKALLSRYDLPPELLKIEVTETLFIGGNLQAIEVLRELRQLGVGVALDDFGTGYSAFAVLREGCIDVLKVDRTFVNNIAENDQDCRLIMEIIQMAHIMNLKVVAEGVETVEQRDLLIAAGCDVLQGYYLGRPMPESDFCPYMNCFEGHVEPLNRIDGPEPILARA